MIDHLVYAVPDLESGIDAIEALIGVRPALGGSHPGWGTRNALLSLGSRTYLEIIGPDPQQVVSHRPLGVDDLDLPRLTTWAMAADSLEERVREARGAGFELGEIRDMERTRPDGTRLSWRLTDPFADRMGGLLPFLIDWGASPHPADTAPTGCTLIDLAIETPEPDTVVGFPGLECQVTVGHGGLVAHVDTPRGVVCLRGR